MWLKLTETEARLKALEAERAAWMSAAPDQQVEADEASFLNEELLGPGSSSSGGSSGSSSDKKWYEKYTLRGYAQFRINETLTLSPDSAPAMHNGDSSVGEDQSFIIRRARLILQGNVTDRVAIYLQPDFASGVPNSTDAFQYAQIRDWYADIFLDDNKVYRIRAGQSKIPYGWENLQSSSNRIPLDRNDAFNSAARNERDLGAFFYWTPEYAQDIFKYVVDEGLKGSGNYGVLGFGFYNGQGGSLREQNDNLHMIGRLEVPMTLPNGQIMEMGVQAYTGMYSVLGARISPDGMGPADFPTGTIDKGNIRGIIDQRVGGTFVWYPQPLGFQAEWTGGRGPALNDAQTEVIARHLHGGYLMTMYRYQTECHGDFFPFVRWNYFKGGYKPERNAPYAYDNDWETGIEWQIGKAVELTAIYTFADRTNTRSISQANTLSYGQFMGDLLRFQLQVNY